MSETIGTIVKTARLEQHWTQADLAQLAGIDVRSLRRLETGEGVSSHTVRSVCAALSLDATTIERAAAADGDTALTDEQQALYQGIIASRKYPPYKQQDEYDADRAYPFIGLIFTLLGLYGTTATLLFSSRLTFVMHTSSYTWFFMLFFLLAFIMPFLHVRCCFINMPSLLGLTPAIQRCRVMLWVYAGIFSLFICSTAYLLPMWMFSILMIVAMVLPFCIQRTILFQVQRMYTSYYIQQTRVLDQLLATPVQTDADIHRVAQAAQEQMQQCVDLDATRMFAPLIWLKEDRALGIATTHAIPLYIGIARAYAENLTEPKAQQLNGPVMSRYNHLARKAETYIRERMEAAGLEYDPSPTNPDFL